MVKKSKFFCFTKYAFMACNAFCIMLGIFVVLFGISFPEEIFPGGFKGKTSAGISAIIIFFTMIGYCGAHQQKPYFLVIYSLIIVIFIASSVTTFFLLPEQSIFSLEGKTFWIVTVILIIVLVFTCTLIYQIRTGNFKSSYSKGVMMSKMIAE